MAQAGAMDWALVINRRSYVSRGGEGVRRVDWTNWALVPASLAHAGGRLGTEKSLLGKCYALKAAAASFDYAFHQLGWDGVTHLIADENVLSQKLAARLGSKPGDYVNLPGSLSEVRLCVWSQTKEEWVTSKN